MPAPTMNNKPVSEHKLLIYQLLPRIFGNRRQANKPWGSRDQNGCGKFSDLSEKALHSIREMGFTHLWLTGILDHATCEPHPEMKRPADPPEIVKGRAGSPYAIRDYYALCPDLIDHPDNPFGDFETLLQRCHSAGLKVLIDHIPNHLARMYRGEINGEKGFGAQDDTRQAFSPDNDFYYVPDQALKLPPSAYEAGKKQTGEDSEMHYKEFPARATGNDCFHAYPADTDWYETVKLNYGSHPEGGENGSPSSPVWQKMKDILLFWAAKGIDGFRCDMAGMAPLSYWEWVISELKEDFPDLLFIAEIYEPDRYEGFLRAGFDYLYDKVGFYDDLRAIMTHAAPASLLSRSWQHYGGFDHRLLRFLENHDEQRIASIQFCQRPEPGIPAMAAALLMHRGPAMLYFGQELGEAASAAEGFSGKDGRTSIFDYWSLPTIQAWQNEGEWNEAALNQEQKSLRKAYTQLLRLATREKCIRQGILFDLQYAQDENPDYDMQRAFAFLRHLKGEAILCVLWFENEERRLRIAFPDHLLEVAPWLKKPVTILPLFPEEGRAYKAENLTALTEMEMPAWSARLFHIRQEKNEENG